MNLRNYISSKDFDNIKNWIDDERTHAMWCAGCFEYPLEKENFKAVLKDIHSKWGDTPFVASLDDGSAAGFLANGSHSHIGDTCRRNRHRGCTQWAHS